mgnify:CR=1 FL=1
MSSIDPVDLTAKLVRCPSVTPADGGAQEVLFDLLTEAGFDCAWADRGGIKNLFARWGNKGNTRSFGFNGHTDVVPIGNEADWTMPPFGAEIKDGIMYGRGTTDMKSGVAAFTAAAIDFVRDTPGRAQTRNSPSSSPGLCACTSTAKTTASKRRCTVTT